MIALLGNFGKPLWITEINRRDGSENGKEKDAADYASKTFARLAADGRVGNLFIYELLDEPYLGGGESHYGLVELARNGQGKWQVSRRKQAFEAFKAVIAAPRQNHPQNP